VQGKRIDLVAVKGGGTVFVEIEMTDENAARNAAEDWAVADASVKQIAVICPTRKVLLQLERAVRASLTPQALARFAFRVVTDL
jgi:hypothetical protein